MYFLLFWKYCIVHPRLSVVIAIIMSRMVWGKSCFRPSWKYEWLFSVTRMSKQMVQLESDKARAEAKLQTLTTHIESEHFTTTTSSHTVENTEEHVVAIMQMKRWDDQVCHW